jgi:anion-transporting  ArsA/GET3 family ATPase
MLSSNNYIEESLSKKIIFFTGKGGVGKSTLTLATALAAKKKGARVAVASWSTLPLTETSKPPLADELQIESIPLETLTCFREYALQILKFERVYSAVFDNHVLKTFVKAAPGLSDTVIAGKLWDLYEKKTYDLILVDLPSTGHALSFFNSPLGIQKMFMVGFVHKEATRILEMFGSSDSRLDIVSLAEELPMTEGLELKRKLAESLPLNFGYLFMNQIFEQLKLPSEEPFEGLSDFIKDRLKSYSERHRQQSQMLDRAKEFQMPIMCVPRFTSRRLLENIENVARTISS